MSQEWFIPLLGCLNSDTHSHTELTPNYQRYERMIPLRNSHPFHTAPELRWSLVHYVSLTYHALKQYLFAERLDSGDISYIELGRLTLPRVKQLSYNKWNCRVLLHEWSYWHRARSSYLTLDNQFIHRVPILRWLYSIQTRTPYHALLFTNAVHLLD